MPEHQTTPPNKTNRQHPAATPQSGQPEPEQLPTGGATPQNLVHLQRYIGNQGVQRLLAQQPPAAAALTPDGGPQDAVQLQRRRRRSAPALRPFIAERVTWVRDALARSDFTGRPEENVHHGGAFYILNGLNPEDLTETVQALGRAGREPLLANIAMAGGANPTRTHFDRSRLESALRAVSWGQATQGRAGLNLLDSIRYHISSGSLAGAFALLTGRSRVYLIAVLRVLDRHNRQLLLDHIGDAPAADQPMLRQVLTDSLGTGTDMQSSDVIDVEGLRGLERTMADIYNTKGQFLQEQAQALNISTASAAGIMKAESGGQTFDAGTNEPLIRFENHVFWSRWGKRSGNQGTFRQHFRFSTTGHAWEGHQFREDPADPWQPFHGNQAREQGVVAFAGMLAGEETAKQCMSMGAGQIMGFNHRRVGFNSAVDMYNAFSGGERPQLSAIFTFISAAPGLPAAIRAGDFRRLASAYNGGGQVAAYAAVIQAAAQAYERVTRGKRHVVP